MRKSIRLCVGRRICKAIAVVMLILNPGLMVHASPYSEIVFFGDSLTDSGAYTSHALKAEKLFGLNGLLLPDYARDLITAELRNSINNKIPPWVEARLRDIDTRMVVRNLVSPFAHQIGNYNIPIVIGGVKFFDVKAFDLLRIELSLRHGVSQDQISNQLIIDHYLGKGFDAAGNFLSVVKSQINKYVDEAIIPWNEANVAPVVSRMLSRFTLADAVYIKNKLQSSFTTNPDKTWAFHLANALGGGTENDWKPAGDGGNNQAFGGARVVEQVKREFSVGVPLVGQVGVYFMTPSVKDQVSMYLQKRPSGLSSSGLYAVLVGANDLREVAESHRDLLRGSPEEGKQQVMDLSRQTAIDVAGQILRLRNAGAGTVLAFNLPDLGRTPGALMMGKDVSSLMSYMALRFNDELNSQLAGYSGNLVMIDLYSMMGEFMKNPARYGLRNVTDRACGETASYWCDTTALVEPDANRTYVFADDIHPTGIVHKLHADYMLSVLQAPVRIGQLAEAPLAGTRAGLRAIEDRLRSRDDTAPLQAYASYQRVNDRLRDDGVWNPGLGNRMDVLSMGVDGGIGRRWTIGVNAAQIQHDATLGQSAGFFRLGQTQLSAYARYRLGDWSTSVIGSAGYLSYRNVSRDFSIGPASLREQGKTNGTATALSASTQYDWHAGVFTMTPSVGVTFQDVNVEGYNESRDGGRTATSMNYLEQERRSLVSTLGLRLRADLRSGSHLWQPYAGLGWEHEFKRSLRSVRAHVRDMAGSFAQDMPLGPADSMLVSAGLNYTNGGAWNARLDFYGKYGGGARSQAVQATVAYRF